MSHDKIIGTSDHFLKPPEALDRLYEQVTAQRPLWPYDEAELLPGAWPLTFCSDEECAALSGIPERSLRILQGWRPVGAVGQAAIDQRSAPIPVLTSTKVPLGQGPYRRVWHLPEAATAAALQCLKLASGVEYRMLAAVTYHAGMFARLAFFNYVKLRQIGAPLDQFGAELILAGNSNLYMAVSALLALDDPNLGEEAIDGVIPIANIEDGVAKRIPLAREARGNPQFSDMRRRHRDALERARFRVTVDLKNVFERFEHAARKMRP
jgi:hypothetical protein